MRRTFSRLNRCPERWRLPELLRLTPFPCWRPETQTMFMHGQSIDPHPHAQGQDPNAGSALQELLGSKYGEMSTLNNYMFRASISETGRSYDQSTTFVASITAEELGHVELVSHGVAMLNNGPEGGRGGRGRYFRRAVRGYEGYSPCASFFSGSGGAAPVDSDGLPWNGTA